MSDNYTDDRNRMYQKVVSRYLAVPALMRENCHWRMSSTTLGLLGVLWGQPVDKLLGKPIEIDDSIDYGDVEFGSDGVHVQGSNWKQTIGTVEIT